LASFAIISKEQRLGSDPYQALSEHAERRISDLAVKVSGSPSKIGEIWDVWLFAPIQDLPFLPNQASLPSADLMWRAGHRYQESAEFADRALRFISCATSESDAERVLSMEKTSPGFMESDSRFPQWKLDSQLKQPTFLLVQVPALMAF
jgi:hypothetical protein